MTLDFSRVDLEEKLRSLAIEAKKGAEQAYAPYSKFTVGCALLSKSGAIYTGCNIENASFAVTLCAERVAAAQALIKGDTAWELLVVVSPQRVSMCGVCRQFMHEFAPGLLVWNGFLDDRALTGPVLLRDLLPSAMTLERT
jgi:cytidine deaminase